MAEDADRHIAVMEDDMELPFAVGSSLEEQPPSLQNTDTMERCRFESSARVLPPLISSSSSSSVTSRNIPELESSVLSASEEEEEEEENSLQQPPPQRHQPRRRTFVSRPSLNTSTLSEEFLDAAASLLWFPESSLAEQPLLIQPLEQQQSPIIVATTVTRPADLLSPNQNHYCPIAIQHHQQQQQQQQQQQPEQPQPDVETSGVDDEEQTQRIDNRRTEDESIASSSSSSSYSPSILSSSSSSSLMLGLVVNGEQSHMSNGPHTATTTTRIRNQPDGLLLFPNPSWHSSTPMIVSTLAGVSAQIIADDSFVVRVWIATTTTTTTLPRDGEDRNTRLLLLSELTIPQHWKHWCEAIQGFVVVVSQSSYLDAAVDMTATTHRTTATRAHDTNRAYDGVWIDATVGPLRTPNSNTTISSCCSTTTLLEYSKRMLGCPTFGRLSLFHDIPNQTISATLGPFPGNWEQRYQMKFRPNSPCHHHHNNNNNHLHDGRFLLETTVRIKRLHHNNDNIPLGCWDKCWQRRTLLQHRDQVMLSMARLKFWVENQYDHHHHHHQDGTSGMQQSMTMSSSIPNDQYSTSNNNHSLECPLLMIQNKPQL